LDIKHLFYVHREWLSDRYKSSFNSGMDHESYSHHQNEKLGMFVGNIIYERIKHLNKDSQEYIKARVKHLIIRYQRYITSYGYDSFVSDIFKKMKMALDNDSLEELNKIVLSSEFGRLKKRETMYDNPCRYTYHGFSGVNRAYHKNMIRLDINKTLTKYRFSPINSKYIKLLIKIKMFEFYNLLEFLRENKIKDKLEYRYYGIKREFWQIIIFYRAYDFCYSYIHNPKKVDVSFTKLKFAYRKYPHDMFFDVGSISSVEETFIIVKDMYESINEDIKTLKKSVSIEELCLQKNSKNLFIKIYNKYYQSRFY